MKYNNEKPKRVERLLIKYHYYKLSEYGDYWNNNNENIIVYIKEDSEKLIPEVYKDTLLKMTNYKNQFRCMSISFNVKMIEIFLNAGYIILSQKLYINKKYLTSNIKYKKTRSYLTSYFMCALIYDTYPVLFLSKLKEPKISLSKFNKYELKINIDFEKIVDNCARFHSGKGNEWLTKPLRDCFKNIFNSKNNIQLISFGLYKDNELKAGEFGIIIGKMYFSYTGYHEESSTGIIQMIKMFKYLKNIGIICCNLFGTGDKMSYKYKFGTIDISREKYIKLFNKLRNNI